MAWRYACNIPTYITGKDENGEPVVLYRVNIFCRQEIPDGSNNGGSNGAPSADSAPFFVLRRYSQFRHLHDQLKAAFPAIMSARGMAPPPKHPLVLGDKRDSLERRRVELEKWMWRLMATPEVARGSQLKAFLDLDKALARAQQQQHRQRLEQQQRLLPDGAPDHVLRGGSVTATPSEAGYGGLGDRHPHLAAYPGGGGGASVIGDDSASDASGPSGVGSMAGTSSSVAPARTSGAAAGRSGSNYTVPPEPQANTAGRSEREYPPQQLRQSQTQHGALSYGAGGGGGTAIASPAVTAGVAQAARLGIHLQNRADVRRVVDLLVQRLEAACSEAEAAASEVAMLRDANQAMAARLGELELERAEQGREEEVRSQLAQSEAVRAALEQRVAELDETLSKRSAAHAQQVAQLQSQLSEARTENAELLRRLQEWDVGSTVTVLAAQQRADELQQRLGEQQRQVDEQLECLVEQKRQMDEHRQRADEQQLRADELQRRLVEQTDRNVHDEQELQGRLQQLGRELEAANNRVQELQGRLKEHEQQLVDLRMRKEQAEAAATVLPPPPPPQQQQQQQHQVLLDRARADNALLAQEVQRLRNAAAAEREVHKSVLAAHSQASAQLAARVQELEAQLAVAAAVEAVQPLTTADKAQELLLL